MNGKEHFVFTYTSLKIINWVKINSILSLLILAVFIIGCSSGNQSKDSLPCIDIRKTYPEKMIILTDIADVTFVHLSSENDDYLYKGSINYVTDNTIIVGDNSSGSVLFFTKDGNPKSHFNRYGTGPEEYSQANLKTILYDETTDEVFVMPVGTNNHIRVYSSKGEYRRQLRLPHGSMVDQVFLFDDQSLFVYDAKRVFQVMLKKRFRKETDSITHLIASDFFLISKTDGEVLDYVEIPNNELDLSVAVGNNGTIQIPTYTRVVKCTEGLLLCNHETDTVFLFGKDKSIIPVICKTPLMSMLEPMVILDNCLDAGRYQFMVIETLQSERGSFLLPRKYLMLDKKSGEIFRQKIILPDYNGKELFIIPQSKCSNAKEYFFELDLFELKQAYKENKLNGKLKELVAKLDENEDNNVFMFVNFK